MKYLMIVVILMNNLAYAECDFATGIVKKEDGYLYTKDCHIRVGQLVKENENLTKAIELKDLAISKNQERVNLWMDTTYKLEDRVNKMEEIKSQSQFLYFGLGIVSAVAVGYGVARLTGR